jgi:hypothetical protein
MADTLIVGSSGSGGTSYCADSFIYLTKFTAVKNCADVIHFRVQSANSCSGKIMVYADNAGEPGALIHANNTSQSIVSGENILTITSSAIVSGTAYWLGIVVNTGSCVQRYATGGTTRGKSAGAYADFTAPDPAGSGYTSYAYEPFISLWGEETTSGYMPSGINNGLINTNFGGLINGIL